MEVEQQKDVSRMLITGGIQDVRILETKLQASLYHLESLASLLSMGYQLELEKISVSTESQRFAFTSLSYVTVTGDLLCGDPLPFAATDIPGFGIESLAMTPDTTNPKIVLMIPVKRKVIVDSVLVGAAPLENLKILLKENSATPQALRYVIKMDGTLLSNKEFPTGSKTLTGYLSNYLDNETLSLVEKDLLAGKTGFFDYAVNGIHTFMSFLPIPKTNWFLVQSVPASAMPRYASILNLRRTLIVVVLLLLFSLLSILALFRWNRRIVVDSRNFHPLRLPDTISGGEFTCRITEGFFFGQISSKLLNLFGCSEKEFRQAFGNSFEKLVYVEDRERVMAERRSQLKESRSSLVEYRVKLADGRIFWLSDWSQMLELPKSGKQLHSLVLDITAQRESQEQMRVSEERYRLVSLQSRSAIFEWDLRKNEFYRSPNWTDLFGYSPTDNTADHIFAMDRVLPEDRHKTSSLFLACREGQKEGDVEIRFKNNEGRYPWVRLCISTLFDEDNRPARIIGRLFDIDQEVKERQQLSILAQTDSLTGLLNKRAIEEGIEDFLTQSPPGERHALCIIDIDHFKQINDTSGHLYGDMVLRRVSANLIAMQDPTQSLMGRVGGDELLVLIKQVKSDQTLMEKIILLS
jgi:PAS domain S-box-containing protein